MNHTYLFRFILAGLISLIVAFTATGQTSAPTIIGAIADKYNSLGARPGKPLTNELPTADGVGRYQKFENGLIFWHPSLGAYEVHGLIAQRYIALGAERNVGYPVTDERGCSDGVGRYTIFKKLMSDGKWAESAIYWSPKTGAWQIYGAIWQKWKADGAQNGASGYPTAAESGNKNYRSQDFQRRIITYTPSKGAVVELYKTF